MAIQEQGEEKFLSNAEKSIAFWQEKLKTEVPNWESLSDDAKRGLADIADAVSEEVGMSEKSQGMLASVNTAQAMRRALSRGYKAAKAGVTPEQLSEAFHQGEFSVSEKH